MAKYERINKKNNPIIWRWRSFKNFFYHIYMRLRGYTPIQFQPFSNRYLYEKRKEIDAKLVMMEQKPAHELVGFKKEEVNTAWYHFPESKENIEVAKGRRTALAALRRGDKENACFVHRTL